MLRLLVSVKDLPEALRAAAAGVDYLDLKDPGVGALGALAEDSIATILSGVRPRHPRLTISATIGDLPVAQHSAILHKVHAIADLGVDLVKVGLPARGGTQAETLLLALAQSVRPVVPVLMADDGVDSGLFGQACKLPFAALMLDTERKQQGSLLERLDHDLIAALAATARRAGKPFGLAGALRLDDVPDLLRLEPAFAGFRSAVCERSRSGRLIAARVRALRAALQAQVASTEPDAALRGDRRRAL